MLSMVAALLCGGRGLGLFCGAAPIVNDHVGLGEVGDAAIELRHEHRACGAGIYGEEEGEGESWF